MEINASIFLLLLSGGIFLLTFLVTLVVGLVSSKEDEKEKIPKKLRKFLQEDILEKVMTELDEKSVNTSTSGSIVTEFLQTWTNMINELRSCRTQEEIREVIQRTRPTIDQLVVKAMSEDQVLAETIYSKTNDWLNRIQFLD